MMSLLNYHLRDEKVSLEEALRELETMYRDHTLNHNLNEVASLFRAIDATLSVLINHYWTLFPSVAATRQRWAN